MATTKTRKPQTDPELPKRVRALRKRMGLSQEKLSELGDFPRHEVSKIENGERQMRSFPARQQLARAFSLTIDDLSAYLEGRLSLENVRRIQNAEAPAMMKMHGDFPGWMDAELDARQMAGGTQGYEFMGARLLPVLRPPRAAVDSKFVIAVAWIFRYSATEEELRRAIEAERREHPTSSAPPRP